MHFSKTFSQLQANFPPELKKNAIEYRQLKKLINQVVHELSSLGLKPAELKQAFDSENPQAIYDLDESSAGSSGGSVRISYEFTTTFDSVNPHLRLSRRKSGEIKSDIADGRLSPSTSNPIATDDSGSVEQQKDEEAAANPKSLIWALGSGTETTFSLLTAESHDDDSDTDALSAISVSLPDDTPNSPLPTHQSNGDHDEIIPIVSDGAFFQTLQVALKSVSDGLDDAKADFAGSLADLSRDIAETAQPVSSTSASYRSAYSPKTPSQVTLRSFKSKDASDLYYWREVFQIYVDSEIFESVRERDRGARSVEDAELRLQTFAKRVTSRGLNSQLHLAKSKMTLEKFLEMNVFILNVKRFEYANTEAVRKILKKHAKRTSLPIPTMAVNPLTGAPDRLTLLPSALKSLPHQMIQSIGETLLPVIPHIDDYSCLICTSLAFKPIRLDCSHIFCVRCLVKMQRRGTAECPLCREATVLRANASNLDISLLNFMADWFPTEAKEKLSANEKEVSLEHAADFGWDDKCIIS